MREEGVEGQEQPELGGGVLKLVPEEVGIRQPEDEAADSGRDEELTLYV